ncbi:LysM peptidoglycan-binding domain-containing protein [Salibaculum halophilum]|uniref:LysM peptidoglycan-binding domain-containing protein n=1 Tax=Salibaculum halophilum TaxID=1914408 RepID=UPI000A11A8C6|nr:LysM peptidoglycan-binding domain-containing protein [Salibaculum halophilum]
MPQLTRFSVRPGRLVLAGTALIALAACDADGNLADLDLRDLGGGFDTSQSVADLPDRPRPDDRGVISYPGYQVVVARQGETVRQIAGRLELNAQELARYNAIEPDTPLRRDEIVALPGRVAEPSPATGAERTGPIRPPSEVDVTTLAADAIDRAEPQQQTPAAAEEPQTSAPAGAEPLRHRVERGETAYSIARLYGVPVRGLAEWNGLGADMTIREGQQLLIPATGTAPTPPDEEVTEPGRGTQAPTPPSAAEPLPADSPETGAAETPPPSPDIGDQSAAATDAPLVYPVSGSIIREYDPPQSRGIVFSTDPGEAVRAAADGTVRLISEEVNGTKFILVNHGNNISTVYIGVADISVSKGDSVSQGETLGLTATGDSSTFQLQVADGTDRVNPADYLP